MGILLEKTMHVAFTKFPKKVIQDAQIRGSENFLDICKKSSDELITSLKNKNSLFLTYNNVQAGVADFMSLHQYTNIANEIYSAWIKTPLFLEI